MYLIFELRRLDVWPVDDLGVRQGYTRISAAPRGADAEASWSREGERFRPYRTVLALYCWAAAGDLEPGGDRRRSVAGRSARSAR